MIFFLSIVHVNLIWGFSIWTYTKKITSLLYTLYVLYLFIGWSKIGTAWCIILGILTCTWTNEVKTVEENPGLKICINDYLGGHGDFEEWLENYIHLASKFWHITSQSQCMYIYVLYIQAFWQGAEKRKKIVRVLGG